MMPTLESKVAPMWDEWPSKPNDANSLFDETISIDQYSAFNIWLLSFRPGNPQQQQGQTSLL